MPEVNIIVKAKDEASNVLKGISGSFGGLGKIALGAGAIGVTALVGIGAAAGKLAYDAAKLEPVRLTFDNLSDSIGETADSMLKELRPATMGTLKDADLMRAANKLMAMSLAESAEEAGDLSEMAVTLGTAMGVNATDALENFTLMLANQSIPRLDTFGISSGKVRERILALMEADEDLTRETAFMTAVMEEGRIAMERVGDVSETGAVKMAAFSAGFGNLKDMIGEKLLPVLHTLMDKVLTPLLTKITELAPIVIEGLGKAMSVVTPIIRAVVNVLKPLAPAILFLLSPITALAAAWATNWGGIQDKVKAVWVFLQPVFDLIAEKLEWIKSTTLPFLQEQFQKTWDFIKEIVASAWEGFKPSLDEMKAALEEFWVEMKPRLEEAWEAIKDAMAKVQVWVETTMLPALRDLWDALEPLREIIIEVARKFGEFMGSGFVKTLKGFLSGLILLWDGLVAGIRIAIDVFGTIQDVLRHVASGLQMVGDAIPDWLIPGSPSPLEASLLGIAEAFREMHGTMGGLGAAPQISMVTAGQAGQVTNINLMGDLYGMGAFRGAVEEAFEEEARFTP